MQTERTIKKHHLLLVVTKLIFSAITLDAAYIYAIVAEMSHNGSIADQYHAVPEMTEHVLAAVVIYLLFMVLFCRLEKSDGR